MGTNTSIDSVVKAGVPCIPREIHVIVISYINNDYEITTPLVKYGYDWQRTPQDRIEVPMYIMIGNSWDYCFMIPKVAAVGDAIQKHGVWKIRETQNSDGTLLRIVKNNRSLQAIGEYVYWHGVDGLLDWLATLV